MSVEGVTTRGRTYRRKFDHDEARRLRADGLTYTAIAAKMGVSAEAIVDACDPVRRARRQATTHRWTYNGKCPVCGARTTRNKLGGDHRCRDCSNRAMATSVRDDALKCARCDEWKADRDFPRNRAETPLRRGRHGICRACQTVMKREYRARNRERENAYQREYKRRIREASRVQNGHTAPENGA